MSYKFDILEGSLDGINENGVKIFRKPSKKLSGMIGNDKSAFITLVYDTDNVNNTSSGVYFSGLPVKNNKRKLSVGKTNLLNACMGFTARKLVKEDFINYYDDFTEPNQEYHQFRTDSLVYSLFHTNMNTGSDNEFFWVSAERMKELADENGYDELYNDARTASDRHVYKLLFGEERIYDKLSDDAKAVLDKATEMVENSIQMRQMMANDENHLNSWDAGYAQLKLVWKEYFPEDFKEFRELYKSLEDRMRPLVYELGFLMK